MDENKKAAPGASNGAKQPSDYKAREADGKGGTDAQFQKAFGKSKDTPRKG